MMLLVVPGQVRGDAALTGLAWVGGVRCEVLHDRKVSSNYLGPAGPASGLQVKPEKGWHTQD